MDKRYYSARHKRVSKDYRAKKENKETSFFILRLNICLGLAIVALGAYKLRADFGEILKTQLTVNTSADTMRAAAKEIKSIAEGTGNGFTIGKEEFVPDEEASKYIENIEENSYYNIQKRAESHNEVWRKPVEKGTVTDVFGNRANPVTGKNENHKGIDIGVPLNTEARAVKSGVVLDTGTSDSYGNWVKYKTSDNYVIMYAHLNSIDVKKNQKIKQGDVIAHTGSTGNSTGPHLHYEIMENDKYIDPYSYYVNAEG